jgi:hypothetical protein
VPATTCGGAAPTAAHQPDAWLAGPESEYALAASNNTIRDDGDQQEQQAIREC